jgi:FtsP/CotA-like multicopper oxidase with cupredoxin domain
MRFLQFLIFFLTFNFGYSQTKTFNLVSEMNLTTTLDDGSTTQYWGYGVVNGNGSHSMSLPGPLLEINKGDTVVLNFFNDSPEDHTIHLHGLDVNQANDGVPTTSFAVHSQQSTSYTFVANHEGTFLYHCHVLTTLHLTMGMYGMIVVENYPDSTKIFDGGPSFNNEYSYLTSDMDLSWNNNTLSIPPMYTFKSNYFLINGQSGNQFYDNPQAEIIANEGDSILLRLGNIAYSKVKFIFPPQLHAKAYLSDGRVLPQAFNCDTLEINAGERYSVLLTPSGNDSITNDIAVEYYEARNNNIEHTNYIKLNSNVSINENDAMNFTVFPNPTNSTLNFNTTELGNTLYIYDVSGKILHQQLISSYNTVINLGDFKSGFYILKCDNQTTKIIKQ